MLKLVKSSVAIGVLSVACLGTAQADVASALQNICTIVKADDKGELRKKMKVVESDFNMKLQDYYSGVSCGGESLIRTAFLNNAIETGSLLVKKMPKSQLSSPEADGRTLGAWVNENNLAGSELAKILSERI